MAVIRYSTNLASNSNEVAWLINYLGDEIVLNRSNLGNSWLVVDASGRLATWLNRLITPDEIFQSEIEAACKEVQEGVNSRLDCTVVALLAARVNDTSAVLLRNTAQDYLSSDNALLLSAVLSAVAEEHSTEVFEMLSAANYMNTLRLSADDLIVEMTKAADEDFRLLGPLADYKEDTGSLYAALKIRQLSKLLSDFVINTVVTAVSG